MREPENRAMQFWATNRMQLTFLVAVGCLMFAFELTNFNLTIDEEIAIRHSEGNQTWISQGRWGMYLLNAILMPSPVVPFVPLLIAIVFAATAFVLITKSLGLTDRVAWYAVAPIFMGCPTLFYAYQFSTFNFGIGAGVFFAALGFSSFLKETAGSRLLSIACMSVAIGIYQSLVLLVVSLWLGFLLVRFLTAANSDRNGELRRSVVFGMCLVLAIALYFLIQEFFYWAYGLSNNSYTNIYFNPYQALIHWQETLQRTYTSMTDHMLGKPVIYGLAIPTLAYLVILCMSVVGIHVLRAPASMLQRLVVLGLALLLVCMPFALNLVNLGSMPTRSLVSLPFVFAVIIYLGIAVSGQLTRFLMVSLVAITVVYFLTANSNLALRDQLAFEADKILAIRIQQRVDELGLGEFRPIPLEVVGEPKSSVLGNVGQLQTVGNSFFTHDQGNIYRIVFFMETLGMESYRAATPDERRSLVGHVTNMGDWPDKSAVALIDGVVVVKFGDYSDSQRRIFCSSIEQPSDNEACR